MRQQKIDTIKGLFLTHYKDAKTELEYKNSYELLVAIVLSAQCTDKRVNIITKTLFKYYPNIYKLANATLDELKNIISSCSFFNNKAKHLISMAQQIKTLYNGNIPLDRDKLIKLDGVGQKSANVLLIEYANANLMAVDTHVFRVSHRLGLSNDKDPISTEKTLTKKFKTDLHTLHQAMVLFGRYICKAKNPQCHNCFLIHYCQSKDKVDSFLLTK